MFTDIHKCSQAYLHSIFAPLDEHKNFVFWIRTRDMAEVVFTSNQYNHIWERNRDILIEIPLIWQEYLSPENRVEYLKQLHYRNSQRFINPEKNIVLYQIALECGGMRCILDRSFRATTLTGEHYIVGMAKDLSPDNWNKQYNCGFDPVDESDINAQTHFFDLLRKEFGITKLNAKQSNIATLSDNNDLLAELFTLKLSKREMECLYYFCVGKTYKQIAQAMFISPRTVETNLERILFKTQSDSRLVLISRYSTLFSKNPDFINALQAFVRKSPD